MMHFGATAVCKGDILYIIQSYSTVSLVRDNKTLDLFYFIYLSIKDNARYYCKFPK